MTVTNHMFTGALVAVVLQRPLLAIPAALLSHFVIDAIPHYGYGDTPFHQLEKQKHFVLKQAIDAYVGLGLFWLIPYLLRNHQAPLVTMLCMLAGLLPDTVWSFYYVLAQRKGEYLPHNWFTRFHKKIQWCERSWGIYVEIVWFGLVGVAMRLIT